METTDDILREMRTVGRLDEKSTDKIPRSLQALGLRTYADRIEKAVTNCNQLKMRSALERLREWALMDLNENAFIADSSGNHMKLIKGTMEIANAALAKPPRNCDVGMACEQAKRFEKYCKAHKCETCPMGYPSMHECAIHWSQTSYEEEGEK